MFLVILSTKTMAEVDKMTSITLKIQNCWFIDQAAHF